ncbi:MAG TPA: hypothetical protein VKE22_00690 [Haliangiales bacterium]|nr:hypothetical protein [Haliangiales bacterium]
MPYVEEREFTFRLEFRSEFPEDYDGEADGYAWTDELRPLVREMLAALVQVVARHPGWRVHPRNRGRSTEDEVTLVLERKA